MPVGGVQQVGLRLPLGIPPPSEWRCCAKRRISSLPQFPVADPFPESSASYPCKMLGVGKPFSRFGPIALFAVSLGQPVLATHNRNNPEPWDLLEPCTPLFSGRLRSNREAASALLPRHCLNFRLTAPEHHSGGRQPSINTQHGGREGDPMMHLKRFQSMMGSETVRSRLSERGINEALGFLLA